MEPADRPNFQLAGAGGVLFGFTAACIVLGAADRLGGGKRRPTGSSSAPSSASRSVSRRRSGGTGTSDGRRLDHPRRPPDSVLPAVAGSAVVVLALPVFLLAGWRIQGWALGAVLWFGAQGFGLLLHRLRTRR